MKNWMLKMLGRFCRKTGHRLCTFLERRRLRRRYGSNLEVSSKPVDVQAVLDEARRIAERPK